MLLPGSTQLHSALAGADLHTIYRRVFDDLAALASDEGDAHPYTAAEVMSARAIVLDAGAGLPREFVLADADTREWIAFAEAQAISALQVATASLDGQIEAVRESDTVATLKGFQTSQWSSPDLRTQPLSANVPNSTCTNQVTTRADQTRRAALFDCQDRSGAAMALEVWVNGEQRGPTTMTDGDGVRRIYSVNFTGTPILGAQVVTLYVRTGGQGGTYRLFDARLAEVVPI